MRSSAQRASCTGSCRVPFQPRTRFFSRSTTRSSPDRRVIVEANGAIRSTARRHQATGIRLDLGPAVQDQHDADRVVRHVPAQLGARAALGASSGAPVGAAVRPAARAGGQVPPCCRLVALECRSVMGAPPRVVSWSCVSTGSERARSRIATSGSVPGGSHAGQTSARWKFWKLRLAVGPRWPW